MHDDTGLSHIKKNAPGMVDISEKFCTWRQAKATGLVIMPEWVLEQLSKNNFATSKGPIFHTAIIAATMAIKNTHQVIPFCHGLALEKIDVDVTVKNTKEVHIAVLVKSFGKTGVEMEALMGVSIAALTIYDMCKSLSSDMTISAIKLEEKTGGKRDVTAKA